jgi:hypothetical protein
VPPYFTAWWEYKPEPTLSLHFEVDNIGRFEYDDQFYNFPGPRDRTALASIEEIAIRSQPHFYIQIRKTFD